MRGSREAARTMVSEDKKENIDEMKSTRYNINILFLMKPDVFLFLIYEQLSQKHAMLSL